MNETISEAWRREVDLVLVLKCNVHGATRRVPHRRSWRSVRALHVEDLPMRADECSGYLGYLWSEYERLPEHMVFVHPDAPTHVLPGNSNILDVTLSALVQHATLPFAHLGHNRLTLRWDEVVMRRLWRGVLGSSVVPGPSDVQTYCCSHFVVSRSRVQLRSRQFYSDALRFVTSYQSYLILGHRATQIVQLDTELRAVCQQMQFLWHVIFGERLELPHRMYDPELPLFLKTRNLPFGRTYLRTVWETGD